MLFRAVKNLMDIQKDLALDRLFICRAHLLKCLK